MVNKGECYKEALELVRSHRHIAIEKADQLRDQLLSQSPVLKEIETKLIRLSREKMFAKLREDQALPRLEEEYTDLLKQREQVLTELGYTPDGLQPQFLCRRCEDTGLDNGKQCVCVKEIAHKKMLARLCDELPSDTFTFDSFSLDYYDEGKEKQQMEKVYNECVDYAKTFSKNSESLYILGNTGLGKTHLTFAIAKEVISKGHSVIYASSQNMITALEKEHFGQLDHPVSDYYLNCDLLILDDLGTEYLSPVAQSSLYNVVNHRILMSLPTIINSNLTPEELEKRYGARLVSRIFGCYRTLHFLGKDVRIQKRLASKKV